MKNRKFLLYPEQRLFSIKQLENKLKYQHTPQLKFEASEEQEEIRQKGIEGEKTKEALQFGKKCHPLILDAYIPNVSIRWTDEAGYGLYAEESISKNRYVGEYTGVVRKNDRRYFEPLNNYCYSYPVLDHIGRNYVIDATEGSLTRFINHSSTPNLKPVYAYWDGYYHVIFITLRKIATGEQFSYNYGESYWHIREKPKKIY